MTVLLIPAISTTDPPGVDYADLVLHINTRIVSAVRARRTVNGWLAFEVGDRTLAGDPELIIGEQLIWRVPVHWTSPSKGILAEHIADVLIDAISGEVLNADTQIRTVEEQVKHAAGSFRGTD